MVSRDRSSLWRELARLTAEQVAAARARDVERFIAAGVAVEACAGRLRAVRDLPATPLERAWARTVRRLGDSLQVLLTTMGQPLVELRAELFAEATGRAGPITLDCRV